MYMIFPCQFTIYDNTQKFSRVNSFYIFIVYFYVYIFDFFFSTKNDEISFAYIKGQSVDIKPVI